MAHLSATEMITELNSTSMTQFEKNNGLVYREPTAVSTQRRLSPWFGKRRYSKGNKFDKRIQDDGKFVQSDKTQQFLKKIFPRKRHKEFQQRSVNSFHQQTTDIMKTTIGQSLQEQSGSSFVFLPIKPINFEKMNTIKQNSQTQRKKQVEQPQIHKVQPQMLQLSCRNEAITHRGQQSPKSSSLVFTFRRSWRKKQRVKTEPIENVKKKVSIDQMYRLLGKEDKNNKSVSFKFKDQLFQTQQKCQNQTSASSSWLIPRSMIKKKNNIKFKSLMCKTQYI